MIKEEITLLGRTIDFLEGKVLFQAKDKQDIIDKLIVLHKKEISKIEGFGVPEPPKTKEEYDYINPAHYKRYEFESIEMMRRIYGEVPVKWFCELTAFKYRMRMGTKPNEPIERDIEKEGWYLTKKIEMQNILENKREEF